MPTIPDIAASVDPHFDQLFAGGTVPALAYGVIKDGELIHSRGLGSIDLDGSEPDGTDNPPSADTLFRIASMTKSFTAATLLSLRDEGRLGLDDHLVDYLPELRLGGAENHQITLRHLLTMTAGFPTDDPWGDRQQHLHPDDFASLLATPLEPMWRPGDRFEYSNLGYALLGRVIESVTGMKYRDVVKAKVLSPLSLTSTGFDTTEVEGSRLATGYVRREDDWVVEPVAGYGAFAPMGGLLSSVSDLTRWVGAMLDAQRFDNTQVAEGDSNIDQPPTPASFREMQTGHRFIEAVCAPTLDSPMVPPIVRHYGFGLFEELSPSGRTISHSGGYPGFGSHMRWHLRSGLGIVALGNRSYAPMGKVAAAALEAAIPSVAESDPIDPAQRAWLQEAQRVVERLTNEWDEALVAEWFTDNVNQDEPWAVRRRHLERLQGRHGRLAPDPQSDPVEIGPAQAIWWLRGERGGRVKVDILLSPHPTPRIQSVTWLSVPEPTAAVRDLAREALSAVDPLAVMGEATASDGVTSATFAAKGGRGKFEVVVDAPGRTQVRPVALRTHP